VSMWAKARLKKSLATTDTYFSLAHNIGFEQSLVGDIIVMDQVRSPEQMLITGYDEVNKFINVQRGYNGTPIGSYKRGSCLRIFRVLNSTGSINMVNQTVEEIDGTTTTLLTESQLIYNWQPNDTCVPGCYWFEFKLLKMTTGSMWFMDLNPIIPTFTSGTPDCSIGNGVEFARRFPVDSEGFMIRIRDTSTSEQLNF